MDDICEYAEQAVAGRRQGTVLQPVSSAGGQQLHIIRTEHVMKCYKQMLLSRQHFLRKKKYPEFRVRYSVIARTGQ
jgi:hypothetical protein